MELGEIISVPDFVSEEKHNKKVCPWHNPNPPGKAKVMDAQEPDEDTNEMPNNLGTKLGKNLGDRPEGEVWVEYEQGSVLRFEQGQKNKTVQTYKESDEYIYYYDLQYAPHHLIPGNESLKDSEVVPFLGDEDVIKNFGKTSYIKKGCSVGYDVNHEDNGVWLPSPYALSMKNKWPSSQGIKVIKKRKGVDVAEEAERFIRAYVAAGIEASDNKQFHMRHADYSAEVKKALNAIGDRLLLMVDSSCPIAKDSQEDGKVDPPMGLKARLNVLSNNLERLLTGSLWRAPIFTDELTKQYADERLEKTKKRGRMTKVL